VKLREINQNEREIMRKLNKEFYINFDEVFKGKKILVSQRREVSVIETDAYKSLKAMKKDPYSAGLLIGKIKKDRFDLGLEGAAIIAAHSKKIVEVNKRQEQVVLYGGDVTSKSAIKDSGLTHGDRCLIVNKHRENIAIGRINKDKIINLRDRGHYLRSGR
jgi:ribosome biogenesis protein Nip4